jgi:hypothetical protein
MPQYDVNKLAAYLDNTATHSKPESQGALKFLKDWFPDRFSAKWADHHFLMTKILWEMFHPQKSNRFERQGYYVIHREAAKTTLTTFGLPQYMIWLRGHSPWVRYDAEGWEGSDRHDYDIIKLPPLAENLIVICSETSNQSAYFVSNIKDTLDTREDMAAFFGPKEPKAFIAAMEEQGYDASAVAKNKWTNDAFITADGTCVVGKGAGQQVRGMNIRGNRPSLILVDDMYSRNNTRTDTRIEDLNRWFYAELSNSLDGTKGKMFFLGTVVHENTVIRQIENSDQWFGLSRPIIGFEELQKVIKDHCRIYDGLVTIPDKDRCAEIEKDLTTLSWPEKHNLFYILNIYKREFEQGKLSYFYQEYLNITQAPEEARFDRVKLKPTEFTYHDIGYGHSRYLVSFFHDDRTWWAIANNVMGVDLASSEKVTADHTVIAVTGFYRAKGFKPGTNTIEERIFPVIPWITGGRGWGTYEEQRENMFRKGMVNEVRKILQMMPIEKIIVETNATQEQSRRALDYDLYQDGIHKIVEGKFSESKKQDRIISVMEPVYNKYKDILYEVRCQGHVETMHKQLTMLGPTETKDDYCDATAISFVEATINALDFVIPGDMSRSQIITNDRDVSRFGYKAWEVL